MRRAPLRLAVFVCAGGALVGCRRHRRAPPPPTIVALQSSIAEAQPEEQRIDPDELLPGNARAFGLTLPVNTAVRFESDETRMYHVNAQMPRVMRYLQQRLEFATADIQPLGAMIRNAHLREPEGPTVFDVGVRDEGDRTLVTLWSRTPVPQPQTRSMADALRAAGIDPRTGRTEPRFNR